MSEAPWWRLLKGDPSRFVLDDSEPGVIWRALVSLLGRPADSPAVDRARQQARVCGAAAAILDRQSREGFWGSPTAYGARWHGSAWQLIAAAAFGADPDDPRCSLGCERLLGLLERSRGGFSTSRGAAATPCFTARLSWAMMRLGFARHPRVREAVAWLSQGARDETLWPCREQRHTVDGTCAVATVTVLHMVAEAPEIERAGLGALSDPSARWLLGRRMLLDGPSPPGWKLLGYPNLGRSDVLEALDGLAGVGHPSHPIIIRALLEILSRQDGGGRWCVAHASMGAEMGEPSRWLTLEALRCLAAYAEDLGSGATGRSGGS